MSIATEITRLQNAIADAYTSVDEKGGTLPQEQTIANLAGAIDTISEGLKPQLTVNVDTGSSITVTDGITTLTGTSAGGSCVFDIPNFGTWTVTATLGGESASQNIIISAVQLYSITLAYTQVYGVLWDGTATTAWSRTDDASGFTDPVPALNGTGGSSPFDTLSPWKDMTVVDDAEAGKLVKIPKFWYKWTRSGSTMKLQIADGAMAGFSVSPAHQDRGDGKGDRDFVYVGKYHCCTSNYKSTSGVKPKVSITRSTARSGIHSLGTTIWQMDYAMLWTIQMLYLVEFANWNSQAKIGYGCGNNSAVENMGQSDSMSYHTGTIRASRTTYGVGVKYRNIEDLWGNCYDWIDGIYFSSSTIYGIKNPANFSDSSGGTNIGTRLTSSNYISAWNTPSASGFEWALYPSAVSGSDSTYITDYCYYYSSGVVLRAGGDYIQVLNRGLFCLLGDYSASSSYTGVGCRLQKLP